MDTEDLVQDVFEKIFQELHTFRGLSSIKTWIYKIAPHMAYDRLRSRSSEKRKVNHLAISMDDPGFGDKELCFSHVTIEGQVIRKQMSSCAFRIVETLEEPFRPDESPWGSRKNNFTFSCADPSYPAALQKYRISRYSLIFVPCRVSASTPKNVNLFLREP
ncbi:MAG: RNA polymerase sigma factor [Desulfatitalea sp.]|nr:RNA polymerase sigma factor [Desulfatitalea sp.]